MSQIEDYMFIWNIYGHYNIDRNVLCKDIELNIKNGTSVRSDKGTIIICNENCKINRYDESNLFEFHY